MNLEFYDEALANRIIHIKDIEYELVEALSYLFDEWNKTDKPITFKICSGGGHAEAAFAVVALMNQSRCIVNTVGMGHVESAATLILAAGHNRKIDKYCTFMHHEDSGEIGGRLSEIKDYAKNLERIDDLWAKAMASCTKKTKNFWLLNGRRKDIYFTPEQLLKMGVVDEIL